MKHDERCELPTNLLGYLTCHCAERAFLRDCSDEERRQFERRTGYDRNMLMQDGQPRLERE